MHHWVGPSEVSLVGQPEHTVFCWTRGQPFVGHNWSSLGTECQLHLLEREKNENVNAFLKRLTYKSESFTYRFRFSNPFHGFWKIGWHLNFVYSSPDLKKCFWLNLKVVVLSLTTVCLSLNGYSPTVFSISLSFLEMESFIINFFHCLENKTQSRYLIRLQLWSYSNNR